MAHHNHEKFVGRFEKAVMQFVILEKARQGNVTLDNLRQEFKGNLEMGGHLDECITELQNENHIRRNGNNIEITDDGREDIQQVEKFALELQRFVGQGGQQRSATTAQQTTTGGTTSGGSNVTQGMSGGNVGRGGAENMGQPKGGPGHSTRDNVGQGPGNR